MYNFKWQLQPHFAWCFSADVYNIYVEDIMVRDVRYIWYGITYNELKRILKENRKLKYLPLVDKPGGLNYFLSCCVVYYYF